MTFKYRLGYYLVGFSLGLFLVAVIWSGKDTRCNYFPNARVLNHLSTKPFYFSEKASKVIAEDWIDTLDIKNTLKNGDVDFDNSNKNIQGGKLYTIEGTTQTDVPFKILVINFDKKALLQDIIKK